MLQLRYGSAGFLLTTRCFLGVIDSNTIWGEFFVICSRPSVVGCFGSYQEPVCSTQFCIDDILKLLKISLIFLLIERGRLFNSSKEAAFITGDPTSPMEHQSKSPLDENALSLRLLTLLHHAP